MKKLTIPYAEVATMILQDETKRSSEAKYSHRLHSVLLVAQGMNCKQVAELFGDATRTVEYWVNRYINEGLAGLTDVERPGRPPKLSSKQLDEINAVLREDPKTVGLEGGMWDGKMLSSYIKKKYDIDLSVRQCQRLFRQFRFRLRKPRPQIAKANPELQEEFKKNGKMAE